MKQALSHEIVTCIVFKMSYISKSERIRAYSIGLNINAIYEKLRFQILVL